MWVYLSSNVKNEYIWVTDKLNCPVFKQVFFCDLTFFLTKKLQKVNLWLNFVKRKAIHLRTSTNKRRAIYVDAENAESIKQYIEQDDRHRKKFMHITGLVLEGLRNTDLYDKENINEKCKDVTAMKFFKGQENDRIYCKEVRKDDKTYVIVAVELHEKKKTNKISSKEVTIIERVASYEYEFEE